MVVFADGETEEGPLHASFKLDKAGEEVVLLQKIGPDTLEIDRLVFGAQARNKTFGRYPDGSSVLEYLAVPTPWASNLMTSLGPEYASAGESREMITLYPVPTDGPLFLRLNPDSWENHTPDHSQVIVTIYNLSGVVVHRSEHDPPGSGLITLSLDGQPRGLYLVKIHSGAQQCTRRVLLQ